MLKKKTIIKANNTNKPTIECVIIVATKHKDVFYCKTTDTISEILEKRSVFAHSCRSICYVPGVYLPVLATRGPSGYQISKTECQAYIFDVAFILNVTKEAQQLFQDSLCNTTANVQDKLKKLTEVKNAIKG